METHAFSDKAIKKKIISMVIPITAENILQMTAELVSMAMVVRISVMAVGAIGLSNVIIRLIWAVFKSISIHHDPCYTKPWSKEHGEAGQRISSGNNSFNDICSAFSGASYRVFGGDPIDI